MQIAAPEMFFDYVVLHWKSLDTCRRHLVGEAVVFDKLVKLQVFKDFEMLKFELLYITNELAVMTLYFQLNDKQKTKTIHFRLLYHLIKGWMHVKLINEILHCYTNTW